MNRLWKESYLRIVTDEYFTIFIFLSLGITGLSHVPSITEIVVCTPLGTASMADREGYPEVAEAYKRYAWEEAEHASKFAELLGDVLSDTKSNLEARIAAEKGACEDKFRIARNAKAAGLDAIHDTVHEMAKDEARHAAGFMGLYKRYFK